MYKIYMLIYKYKVLQSDLVWTYKWPFPFGELKGHFEEAGIYLPAPSFRGALKTTLFGMVNLSTL